MKKLGRNSLAVGLATLLVTSAVGFSANAAEEFDFRSYAEAQYVAGSGPLLGANLLDPLADVIEGGDIADNSGTAGAVALVDTAAGTPAQVTDEVSSPLNALDALTGPLGDLLGAGVGPIGSFAQADRDTSRASSGALTSNGVINVGSFNAEDPRNAEIDLTGEGRPLEALEGLGNVRLVIGAVASTTAIPETGQPSVATHDYQIAGGQLILELEALQGLLSSLDGLNTLGIEGIVSINGVGDLLTRLTTLTGQGVVLDLTTGTVTIDIAGLLAEAGLDLNDLDPNTAVLPTALNQVLAQLPVLLQSLSTNLQQGVNGLQIQLVGQTIPLGEALNVAITGPLLRTAVDAILNPLLTTIGETLRPAIEDVFDAITPLVDLRANVQEANPGSYRSLIAERLGTTENVFSTTALRLSLLGDSGLGLNLGNSLTGPNSRTLVEIDDQSPGDGEGTDAEGLDGPGDNVAGRDGGPGGAIADADAQADADVSVALPNAGAPNLLPFWLLGLGLVLFGAAVMINERRRALL